MRDIALFPEPPTPTTLIFANVSMSGLISAIELLSLEKLFRDHISSKLHISFS
jgi:hypothetical protein